MPVILARAAALALLLVAASEAGTWTPPGPPGGTFVHLFEWSWDDIARECEEWLSLKGYTAVQISPPNEHSLGKSWARRYQPVSYKLTGRSGNETQFISMIQRCKAVGIGIYADVVVNQMAPFSGVGTAGTKFGDRTYPPNYGPEDMHHLPGDLTNNCGVSDYHNRSNVQTCDLLGMPDLCTGCEHVQKVIAAYITRLQHLGIAGFRIDAAKHMAADELAGLLKRVDPNLYRFLEVIEVHGEAVGSVEYFPLGQVTEVSFGYALAPKFLNVGGFKSDLSNFGEGWNLNPSWTAVVFSDNHDTQRSQGVMTFKQGKLYVLLNVYMLAFPYGYPKVMSSYYFESALQGPPSVPVHTPSGAVRCGEGHPWVCEHRWTAIANMVAWRRSAALEPLTAWQTAVAPYFGQPELPAGPDLVSGNTMAFCRGARACVALNRMESEPWVATLHFTVPPDTYCDVAQSDDPARCPIVHVLPDGTAHVTVPPLGVLAFHIGSKPLAREASASAVLPQSSASLPQFWTCAVGGAVTAAALVFVALALNAQSRRRRFSMGEDVAAEGFAAVPWQRLEGEMEDGSR